MTFSTIEPRHILQTPWEFERFRHILALQYVQKILEIGVMNGGTLEHWLEIGEVVTAIDVELRYPDRWEQMAKDADVELHLLQGMSEEPSVIEQAEKHGPYDLIFIDGAHEYHAVRQDWENYQPMVAPGGIVAFHDIQYETVGALWREIKSDYNRVEIIGSSNEGIGMVWL